MTDGNSMETQNTPGDSATNGLPDPANPDHTTEMPAEDGAVGSSVSPQVTSDHPQPQPQSPDDEESQPPEPKPTQTDHLNKSLLTSFLDRLNNPDMANNFPAVQRIDTEDPEEALEITPAGEYND